MHATQHNDPLAVCHKLIAASNLCKEGQPAATRILFTVCVCHSLELHPTIVLHSYFWSLYGIQLQVLGKMPQTELQNFVNQLLAMQCILAASTEVKYHQLWNTRYTQEMKVVCASSGHIISREDFFPHTVFVIESTKNIHANIGWSHPR